MKKTSRMILIGIIVLGVLIALSNEVLAANATAAPTAGHIRVSVMLPKIHSHSHTR